ncbi:hypothetical protein [Halalkalibacter wakoensis]|nr:hypothetical protein [Halalkalibacter wakoensis]
MRKVLVALKLKRRMTLSRKEKIAVIMFVRAYEQMRMNEVFFYQIRLM